MPAYELFPATTTNLFIENIKNKAEAYGWTVDYYAAGRLHLHNAPGAHFEIWYASSTAVNIAGCTGYDSGSGSTAQPNVSPALQVHSTVIHFIIISPLSIYIKNFIDPIRIRNLQFGSIVDKVGSWNGGIFISGYYNSASNSYGIWPYDTYSNNTVRMYIDNAWIPGISGGSPSVFGVCNGGLYGRMPFAYSGGVLPAPILLVKIDPTTTSLRAPIGHAPDLRRFVGGSVYSSLEVISIDGDSWLPINDTSLSSTLDGVPNLLVRLP